MDGRLDSLIDRMYERFHNRFFRREKVFVDLQGDKYYAQIAKIFPPKPVRELAKARLGLLPANASQSGSPLKNEVFPSGLSPARLSTGGGPIGSPVLGVSHSASSPAGPMPAAGTMSNAGLDGRLEREFNETAHSVGTDLDLDAQEALRRDDPEEYLYTVQLMDENSNFEGSFMEVKSKQLGSVCPRPPFATRRSKADLSFPSGWVQEGPALVFKVDPQALRPRVGPPGPGDWVALGDQADGGEAVWPVDGHVGRAGRAERVDQAGQAEPAEEGRRRGCGQRRRDRAWRWEGREEEEGAAGGGRQRGQEGAREEGARDQEPRQIPEYVLALPCRSGS